MLNMSTIAGSIQLTIAQVPIVAGSFFFYIADIVVTVA